MWASKLSFLGAHLCLYAGILLILSGNQILQDNIIDFNEYLEGAAIRIHFFDMIIPVSLLDLFGSILSCFGYKTSIASLKKPVSWIESLVACTLLQFGGTTLTGLLLGQTPSWILSHSAFPALFIAWWFTFHAPFDFFYGLCRENHVFLFFVGIGSSISAGHAVTSWGMDKALFNAAHVNTKRISESILTCIFCGTLSACGGGLLNDWFSISRARSFLSATSPTIFTINNYGASATLNRAFLCAVVYYCAMNPSSYLPWESVTKEQGHLLIVILQVGHFISKQFIPQMDAFQVVSDIILRLAMIAPIIRVADEFEENDKEE